MIFVVPRCRACQVEENTIQNCLVSSILSCMLRDWVSGSDHIKEAHCLHLQRHSSCATWLLKIKALFGNHVPSDAPHIPYDHNPRLTAVKTAKLTWRTWFSKVLLAIVYEDHMYYTYEKCSKVFVSNLLNHMYSTYELSAVNIFPQNRKSEFRESFILCISTLHHGWSVRWKNIV
jgi:hypothetical protein